MTLTIITGTHTFIDLTGKFRNAIIASTQSIMKYKIDGVEFKKHRFDRITINKDGRVTKDPMRILPIKGSGYYWTVSQPTGALKTALAAELMYRTAIRGGNIKANFSFGLMKHNLDKPKENWTPNITCIEDITKANNTRLTIDDIKGTIDNWHAKEADIISMAANLGRKESVDIDITSQGVTNYVPPNIRRIATGYMIPYCTIRDKRIFSPDGKGFPREVEIISLIPGDMNVGDVFVGFGFLNGDIPDGKLFRPTQRLFDSYMTMEHAIGLKVGKEEGARPNQPGYELEVKALEYLKSKIPSMTWKHLNGKHVFDIVSDTWAIDICDMDDDGNLITEHKNMMKHISTASKKGQIPYLMFPYKDSFGMLRINKDVDYRMKGQRIDTFRLRIKTLEDII